MLAFLPGTQEIADLFITIIVTVVGSGWAGVHFFVKKREQDFLMKERRELRRSEEVKEIRNINMQEEEHNIRMRALESEAELRADMMKQLASNGKLELTSDGRLKPKS